jgi:CheY-like chemotaxis protein
MARILVVDGEPRTTLVLDRALTEYGHGVDAASDGPQASSSLRQVPTGSCSWI